MDLDWVRRLCLSFRGASETVQWGNDLVFKVAGKMFAVLPLEPGPLCLSFKCSPADFAELTERVGIVPAPYLARAHWVALKTPGALSRHELEGLVRRSYSLVVGKLPKKARAELND